MAKGKLILIAQSGGEFVTNDDGTMTYNGGEANAANVTSETPFNDLKLNLAETCNFNQETVAVKYFLPGNKRNLITVKNDKDVKRMIDFHGDALTAEVFVTGTPGFVRIAVEAETNRQSNTKTNETTTNEIASPKKEEVVKVKRGKAGTKKEKKPKKEDKGQKSPLASPSKRVTRRSVAESKETEPKTKTAEESTEDTSTSADSEPQVNINQDSDCSSDFTLSSFQKRRKTNTETTPADSVKKRRRTPSWKFANGRPTIVSTPNDSGTSKGKIGKSQRKSTRLAIKESGTTKSGKKRGRPRAIPLPDTSDQEPDNLADVAVETLEAGVKLDKEQNHGHEDSYNKLPWFCEKILETNPGSVSKLVINENKRFKSLFVSFYATLSGFQNSCRPLLFLESISLRSKYGELLFTAYAIDGNDGFFPVSFAVVDTEDNATWRWFLENLKSLILTPQPITFVFDRDKNLKFTILEVFENAYIGYSIYHLLESFKRAVKGPFHGDGKSFLPVHFLTAAHAVRLVGFKKSTEQIKLISTHAYDWVMQIEPQHWTSYCFEGERYNHVTDDININVSISKLMEDYKELPFLQKIDALIRLMIDEMSDANLDASMWGTHLTPSKEKQLQEENLRSCGLKVLISSDILFEVREESTHVVNLSNWSCTCLGWKETGLPCRHALAVFALIGKNPYEFCSNYFTVDAYRITYAGCINPVPIEEEKVEVITLGGENVNVEKIEVEVGVGEKIGEIGKEEWEMVEDGQKSEKVEVEGEKMQMDIEIIGVENEESVKLVGEIEEGVKVGGENEKIVEVGGEIEVNVEVGGEIEENVEVVGVEEKVEKDEGGEEKVEKDGGENEKSLIVKEDEVLVLPPIPVKPVDEVKEKMEWEEKEVETKRTVTCTKCKQPGHNKKSCNLYQVQQALTLVNQV